MASSCSSANNACASCAPSFFLFYIETSTSQSKVGHGCINGDPSNDPFASKIGSGGSNYSASDNVICLSYNESISYSHKETYSYILDEFGFIAIGINALISMNLNAGGEEGCDDPPTDLTNNQSYSYKSIAKKNSCEEDQVTQNGNLGNIPGSLYCSPPAVQSFGCNSSCDRNDSCTVSASSNYFQCSASFEDYWARDNQSENIRFSLSESKNLSFFYDLCKSSVSTKIGILETNQPQNCNGDTCGEGKDACWGAYVAEYFSLNDNNLDDPEANTTTSQKLSFKMATIKEGFDKTYKSVSGKLKFYYGGTDGKTPCCDDDFDGTVLKEAGFSISAGSSTFKDIYLASDGVNIDNNDQSAVGQAIRICSTINDVSFI